MNMEIDDVNKLNKTDILVVKSKENFQSSLWKVIETFQNASNEIENNFIPLFHSDASPEDQLELERKVQEAIVGNLKQVLEIIGGGNLADILSNEIDRHSQHDGQENDSISVETSTLENNNIATNSNTENCSNINDFEDVISETANEINEGNCVNSETSPVIKENYVIGVIEAAAIQDSNNTETQAEIDGRELHSNRENIDCDDDITVFDLGTTVDVEELKLTNDNVEIRNNQPNNNAPFNLNSFGDGEVAVTNSNILHGDNASDNVNSQFQDTQTSVSEFRVYNDNKNTFVSGDENLPDSGRISVTNTNPVVPVDNAVKVSKKQGSASSNPTLVFQDSPTSVSDFRVYNDNKNSTTDGSLPSTGQNPQWLDKVTSYLDMLPEEVPSFPNSQESLLMNSCSEDADEDNLTSISQFRKVPSGANANPTKQCSLNPELLNDNSNKENFPANRTNVETEHDRSKTPKETFDIGENSNHSSDSIEIIKDMNPRPDQIPILLGADDESETFHVGDVSDEQSMTCVSINLLKSHVQLNQNSNGTKQEINTTEVNVSFNDKDLDNEKADGDTALTTDYINSTNNNSTFTTPKMRKKVFDQSENDSITKINENNSHIPSALEQSTTLTQGSDEKANENTSHITSAQEQSTNLTQGSDEKANEDTGIDITQNSGDDDEMADESKDETTSLSDYDGELSRHTTEDVIIERPFAEPSEINPDSNIVYGKTPDNIEPCETFPERLNTPEETYLSVLKQESLHIIDDYTLMTNSQELERRPIILSQSGNFLEDEVKDECDNEYDVIPSVKVEVVMRDDNESDTNFSMNESVNPETTSTPDESTEKTKKKKNEKKIQLVPVNARDVSSKQENIEKRTDESSTCVLKKKPGPKSKTTPKKSSSESLNKNLSQEIRHLTNLNNINKHRSSGKICTRKKIKSKKPKLLDYFDEKRSINESSESVFSSLKDIEDRQLSCLKPTDLIAEELAKNRILLSDDDEESLPPIVKSKKRDSDPMEKTTSIDKPNPSSSCIKPIPSWKKDRLLTSSLDSPTSRKKSINKPISNKRRLTKNNIDDDDVRSVCSQIQEKIRDSSLRENLKKLFDHRETIVPAISVENKAIIDISSSEEEEEEAENIDNHDDDINSELTESNERELISKFKTTAQVRKRRVSSLQMRAQKILRIRRSRLESCSSQEVATFEDRYKDVPPLVLDIDEETGDVISLCPFYSKILKEHQKRGVQFMWDTCFGSKKKILLSDEGSGCILAHDMGLGKSLQVIALLHTLKCREDLLIKKILILSPKSLVQNWEDEITKWTKGLQIKLTVYSWTTDKNLAVQDIHEWSAHGGIYVLGYQMFVNICKKTDVNFRLIFLNPGPDLVICDEAHLLKNNRTETHRFLTQIQTRRRIALTGTPIQNNLQELYNIVSFVQPNFMSKERFRDQFIHPISRAQDVDATTYERNKATRRISVLHKELEVVMDREQSNQEVGLPPKLTYDIFLHLEPLQKKLYEFFCEKMKACYVQPMIFPAVRLAEIISIHPKSLETLKPVEELCKGKDWNEELKKGNDWHADLKGAWWKKVLTKSEMDKLNLIDSGVKVRVALNIIESAVKINEKVLLFCSAKQILNLMQSFLELKGYVKNVNYFRLDGNVPMTQRKKYLNTFNDEKNTNAKVFLMTHKVGGVGLNFTGANRIIILDMPWNPSHHEQSSNRTHRLGQKKTSYIYRLITKGTLEENIYKTTMAKQSLSKRVVDKKKIKSMFRAQGTFNFIYRDTRSKKDLPPAKDDLLNSIFQSSDELSIHSYGEQGRLFELSEEQLNEGQAYEEYLLESKTFDVPGETKRKRMRKVKMPSVVDEAVPNSLMTKDHIENYNHSALLSIMQNSVQNVIMSFQESREGLQQSLQRKRESLQQEPLNLSRNNEPGDVTRMPPPPLVPIPRGKFRTKKIANNDSTISRTSTHSAESLQNVTVISQEKANESERFLQDQTPVNTTIHQLPNNSSRYTSISEFINTVRQETVSEPSNENPSASLEKLAKNPELAIIKRPLVGRSTENEKNPSPPSTKQPAGMIKKVGTQKRLSINPDIFIRPPSDTTDSTQPSEQEMIHPWLQQKQPSLSQPQNNAIQVPQKTQSHKQAQPQKHLPYQQITQRSRKRGRPESTQPQNNSENLLPEKRRRIQSENESNTNMGVEEISNAKNYSINKTVLAPKNSVTEERESHLLSTLDKKKSSIDSKTIVSSSDHPNIQQSTPMNTKNLNRTNILQQTLPNPANITQQRFPNSSNVRQQSFTNSANGSQQQLPNSPNFSQQRFPNLAHVPRQISPNSSNVPQHRFPNSANIPQQRRPGPTNTPKQRFMNPANVPQQRLPKIPHQRLPNPINVPQQRLPKIPHQRLPNPINVPQQRRPNPANVSQQGLPNLAVPRQRFPPNTSSRSRGGFAHRPPRYQPTTTVQQQSPLTNRPPLHSFTTHVRQRPPVSVQQRPVRDVQESDVTSQVDVSPVYRPMVRLENNQFELTNDTVDEFLDRLPAGFDLNQCLTSCLENMRASRMSRENGEQRY